MTTAPSVTFNYATWIATFPEFKGVSSEMGQSYFDIATLYFQNCGWTGSLPQAPTLLYMLTSHVAWLLAPRDGNGNPASSGVPAPPLVGRISSAAEGSVNVSTELDGSGSPSEAFFSQTKYGLLFWQGTSQFRTARWVGGPRPIVNGVFPSRRPGLYGRLY